MGRGNHYHRYLPHRELRMAPYRMIAASFPIQVQPNTGTGVNYYIPTPLRLLEAPRSRALPHALWVSLLDRLPLASCVRI
jgi:hypothetical protein